MVRIFVTPPNCRIKLTESRDSMGAWGGKEYFWPKVRGFRGDGERYDKFGDAYVFSYHALEGDRLDVDFDATALINSEGKREGTWTAHAGGLAKRGQFKKVSDTPKILGTLLKWSRTKQETFAKKVKTFATSGWMVEYDREMDAIEAEYRGRKPKYSDYHMTITFYDAAQALQNKNKTGFAKLHFSEGADYEGHSGVKEAEYPFRTAADIKRILKRAETNWAKWTKPLKSESVAAFRRLLVTDE